MSPEGERVGRSGVWDPHCIEGAWTYARAVLVPEEDTLGRCPRCRIQNAFCKVRVGDRAVPEGAGPPENTHLQDK